MSELLKPCVDCGELSDGPRCQQHRTETSLPKGGATARGYDYQWEQLSKRARKLQPFCTDCGTTEDLTADHSPQAWARKAKGLPIRLQDVAVVCRPCNSRRGKAKHGERPPTTTAPDPLGRQSSSYTRRPGNRNGGGDHGRRS